MKKHLIIFTILSILLFPVNVFASGGFSVSSSSLEIETGSNASFTITVYNAIGDVTISSSNTNVATVSSSAWDTGTVGEGESKSTTITVYAKSAGNATITIYIDAATFDGEDLAGQTKTVTVKVKNPTTAVPTTTTTTTTQQTTRKETTTTTRTTQQQEQQIEETTTETTTTGTTENPNDLNKNNVDDRIELSKVKIVGYDLDFDPTKKEQTIYVYSGVKELYVTSDPYIEGSQVTGNGIVDIVNNDSFILTVTNGDLMNTYTFNVEYIDNTSGIVNTGDIDENNTVSKKKFIVTTCFCIIIILLQALAFIEHNNIMRIFKK